MLQGKCLCEGVRIEIDAPLGPVIACHCSLCRRSTGSAFNPNASVPAERFQITSGRELVHEFSRVPGTYRVLLTMRFAALRRQRYLPDYYAGSTRHSRQFYRIHYDIGVLLSHRQCPVPGESIRPSITTLVTWHAMFGVLLGSTRASVRIMTLG